MNGDYVNIWDLINGEFKLIEEQEDIKKIEGPYCSIEIFDESNTGIRDSAYWLNAFSKNDSNLLDFCCKLHEKQDEIIKELNKLKKEINE